jgi:hypothetical protein
MDVVTRRELFAFAGKGGYYRSVFSAGWQPQGELRQRPRNLLVYHPDLPLSARPVRASIRYTNTLSHTKGVHAWNFAAGGPDALRAVGRVSLSIFIYLSGAARAPASRIWRERGKRKARSTLLCTVCTLFDGTAPARSCPAILQTRWAELQSPAGHLLAGLLGPIFFFSLLAGFTATLSSKRSENNIESRETIGLQSIVHKESISPLLPFATTPHRAPSSVPLTPWTG